MGNILLNEVFGQSVTENFFTYIKRDSVDEEFLDSLISDKQIMIYGSSKQGKTTLLQQYIEYNNESNVVYCVTKNTELVDIYLYVLKKAGLRTKKVFLPQEDFHTGRTYSKTSFNSIIDLDTDEEFDISEPQQVATLLKDKNFTKIIILENFHYLSDEEQKVFAFDLRTFQDIGIRFIILGVWRDRNKLAQYNGDLLDRVHEIPVEPWQKKDFLKVIEIGEEKLNIKFSEPVKDSIINMSFSSIGVLQDLLHQMCNKSKIRVNQSTLIHVDNVNRLNTIFHTKAETYGTRHKNALKAIASYSNTTKLNLSYYIIQTILNCSMENLEIGLSSQDIIKGIKNSHSLPELEEKYIKSALSSLSNIQSSKDIAPPILSYDDNAGLLHITDSTLYFWLKNTDINAFSKELKMMYGKK